MNFPTLRISFYFFHQNLNHLYVKPPLWKSLVVSIIPLVSDFNNIDPCIEYNSKQLVRQELELGDTGIDHSRRYLWKFQGRLFHDPGYVS